MGVRTQKQLKKQAVATLGELSEDRLKVALDFLEYLKVREEWEATWEVMAAPEALAAIREAEDDWKAGRTEHFIPLEEVKRRVQGRPEPTSCRSP